MLLRHATPVPEDVDAARPLSETGKEEAAYAADGLCAYLELPSNFMPKFASGTPCAVKIMHSGKERAAQTAACVERVGRAGHRAVDPCVGDAQAGAVEWCLSGGAFLVVPKNIVSTVLKNASANPVTPTMAHGSKDAEGRLSGPSAATQRG